MAYQGNVKPIADADRLPSQGTAIVGYVVEGPGGLLGHVEKVMEPERTCTATLESDPVIPAGVVSRIGRGETLVMIRAGRRGSVCFFVSMSKLDSVDHVARRVRVRHPEILATSVM